jgi:amino acid transporter
MSSTSSTPGPDGAPAATPDGAPAVTAPDANANASASGPGAGRADGPVPGAGPGVREGVTSGSAVPGAQPPPTATVTAVELPEALGYRLKNKLLGPPLVTEELANERLGKFFGLGVLAPDMISSSAYGTEEMLTQLVPWFGVAAFSLVIPITLVILGVLFFVTTSYLDVIRSYTKAGGSYVVARDNLGTRWALVGAVALLIDYTVTVAVQCTAGTDALTSLVPGLAPYTVEITVAVIVLLCYGNLRGIREGAKFFAFPTYFFVASLSSVVVVGIVREAIGNAAHQLPHATGMLPLGHHSGLVVFASIAIILKSFANGGSSLTGLEAISNSVGAFRRPEARNGRITLVVMCSVLGFLVLGVTLLAHWSHASPYTAQTPTVVAQVAGWAYGTTGIGVVLRDVVLVATMLVLFTGGNTSFNGFPYLASFVAEDRFLPGQMTKRGHRLAFSNGIIVLAVIGIALVAGTGADLNSLVALYAIGVFTGFTLAGAGMVKHHHTDRDPGWRWRSWVNGFSAVLSGAVVLIFAVFKFTEGAWLVVVAGPLLYLLLFRLHRQYQAEARQLESGAAAAAEAPILRRHTVLVLVERLDLASARAIQYGRTLMPDDLRAVHLVIDARRAQVLEERWGRLGLARFPLDLVECPDRRLGRAVLEVAAAVVADGQTELTMLLPRRGYDTGWARLLHDRTADKIAAVVGQLPHVNATLVPFNLSTRFRARPVAGDGSTERSQAAERSGTRSGAPPVTVVPGTVPVGEVTWRQRSRVAGRVTSVRVQPRAGVASLECVLTDDSGSLLLVFQGRRRVPGIRPGTRLVAEGMVGQRDRRLAIVNPVYELVAAPDEDEDGQ